MAMGFSAGTMKISHLLTVSQSMSSHSPIPAVFSWGAGRFSQASPKNHQFLHLRNEPGVFLPPKSIPARTVEHWMDLNDSFSREKNFAH